MSSVWTTTAPGTAWAMRSASVVFPLLLRPSIARTTGRPATILPRPPRITASMTALSSSTRHGPASGSSGASCSDTLSPSSDPDYEHTTALPNQLDSRRTDHGYLWDRHDHRATSVQLREAPSGQCWYPTDTRLRWSGCLRAGIRQLPLGHRVRTG